MTNIILEKKVQKIAKKAAMEAVSQFLIKFMSFYKGAKSVALLAQKGGSFDFLNKELDLYSLKDIKK